MRLTENKPQISMIQLIVNLLCDKLLMKYIANQKYLMKYSRKIK